jgi:riboflavin kinase/FMN adenylyltransferase
VHIEVHLLDFAGDLYDGELRFDLEFAVRPERRFPSVEALKTQIGQDIAFTRARLSKNPQIRP